MVVYGWRGFGGKMAELLQRCSVEGVADGHAVEYGVSGGAQRQVLTLLGFLLTALESFLEYQ